MRSAGLLWICTLTIASGVSEDVRAGVREALGWPHTTPVSASSLLVLPEATLLELYREGTASGIPSGWIEGTAIVRPGSDFAPVLSRGAGLVWQGKTFRCDATAVNRFFGSNVVEGELFWGPSWLDGRTSLILDYGQTSRVYRRYRDEIRMISPGLYLGLMFDRVQCPPRLVRSFALESP
jgi:hypothetical protein